MALGVGLAALMQSGLRSRIRGVELASGALLLWLVLAVAATVAFAGASYAFAWPLLFSSAGLWGWFLLRRSRWARSWGIVLLALFTVPAMVLVAPALYVAYVGESIHQIWIPMAVLGILAGLLALPLEIMARPRKSWLPVLMGLIVVGFLVTGHLTSDYTPTRPARDGVYYALNADKGEAYWVGYWVEEGGLDVYTKQFLGEDAQGGDIRDIWPWATSEAYKAPAPLTELASPTVEQLNTTGPEALRLHVTPAPGTWVVSLWTVPGPTPVTYYVNDEAVDTDGLLIYWAPPAEGFDVTAEAPAFDTLTLRVVNQSLGMPTLPGFSYEPRPDWIIPDTGSTHQTIVVAKTFTFEQE